MSSGDMRLFDFVLRNSRRLIVELGMGDGLLLKKLIEQNCDIQLVSNTTRATYVGIEIDKKQYDMAKARIRANKNVFLLNAPQEDILPLFPNNSIDQILYVLPDPKYIDKLKQSEWESFYKASYSKLKNQGLLRLVTELTNDLLDPVSDEEYETWIQWLSNTFQTIGFTIKEIMHLPPDGITTRYLIQFGGDIERIRIATLDLMKEN